MERSDFYEMLSTISNQYNWDINDNEIVAHGLYRDDKNPSNAVVQLGGSYRAIC